MHLQLMVMAFNNQRIDLAWTFAWLHFDLQNLEQSVYVQSGITNT